MVEAGFVDVRWVKPQAGALASPNPEQAPAGQDPQGSRSGGQAVSAAVLQERGRTRWGWVPRGLHPGLAHRAGEAGRGK